MPSSVSIFKDDGAARDAFEILRWPNGPVCPHCGSDGLSITKMAGEKHRPGLYTCGACHQQFTVTVGTALERTRIGLSSWMRALREISSNASKAPTLLRLQEVTGVTHKTVWAMRQLVHAAAKRYRGQLVPFGAHVRAIMNERRSKAQKRGLYPREAQRLRAAGRHPAQHTVKSEGILMSLSPAADRRRKAGDATLDQIEALARLLLR
jgi:transposase-like protein